MVTKAQLEGNLVLLQLIHFNINFILLGELNTIMSDPTSLAHLENLKGIHFIFKYNQFVYIIYIR
jgi:hypothetical protein